MSKSNSQYKYYAIITLAIFGLLFLISTWFFIRVAILGSADTILINNESLTSEDVIKIQMQSPEFKDPLITVVPEDQQSISSKSKVFISNIDPSLGSDESRAFVIIYGNFADPQVSDYILWATNIVEDYDGNVTVVWKDYVSPDDERATAMAVRAHCAAEQNRFWQFADALQNRESDDDATLLSLTLALGMDELTFNECLDSGGYEAIVEQNYFAGNNYSVSNGHTLFVNDRQYNELISEEELRTSIDEVLVEFSE